MAYKSFRLPLFGPRSLAGVINNCKIAWRRGTMEDEVGGLGDQEYETYRISLHLELPKEEAKPKPKPKDSVPIWFRGNVLRESFVHPTSCTLVTADQQSVPVFRVNVSDPHCLKIMMEVRHPNILRAESIITDADNMHTLLVRPYVGNLVEYFEDQLLNHTKNLRDIIPLVQVVFRQIIDSMIYLMDHDLYHGDMKLENTYFCLENGEPVIKLANFKEWTARQFDSDKLPSEWNRIGNALDKVVELINKHKPKANMRFLCEMKDLVKELKTSRTTPDQKKELAPRHFFFWSPEKRVAVFTYNIPTLFQDKVFVSTVIDTFICPSDFLWNEDAYDGLLSTMNKYRESKFKSKYMGLKKTHYLKFVSGCYTHEKEFKEPLYYNTVDATFREYDPELVLRVMKLLKAYETELQK